ncbi:protein SODIUM POTASSIUM ROOT DEFECTIVE 2 isoform X2 [Syzygium oleosum]|uniref:protein SODIUM POTASSIUM ROOT DEFECTIVE 2 isoform X2 n=1 Tax=Syzygium oleosum TaxID=219896 RepID=UPI0024B9793F|nr:protein SODIUM POTASSIUM ROOT DEFECTIVE 2 isoform X2 [Syzygium oleosum]
MKRMDLFCASPASTAICTSLDQRSMVRHGTTRPIDRHNRHHPHHPHHHHQLRDRRKHHLITGHVPCSSHQLPFTPRPYSEKPRKSTGSSSTKLITSSDHNQHIRRKSSADVYDLASGTPHGSARYLLSDRPFVDCVSESARVSSALVPVPQVNNETKCQVVVLSVSLHCKGCESKVRKHLSKMEGVTSFSIDMETKKVTVKGDVTPLGVLTSVSRVKNAQLWPSSTTSSSPSWSS